MPAPIPAGVEGRLPEIDADGLLHAEIPVARRGYDHEAVDELLERAAVTISRLQALDEPAMEQRRRTQADLLHRTLLLAQAGADHHLAAAESEAASVVAEAEARASRLVAEAEHAAQTLTEARAAQARSAIARLLERRALLDDEVDQLERFAVEVRVRLRDVLTHETATLERLLQDATSDRPRLRQIDLTEPMLERSSQRPVTPPSDDDPLAWMTEGRARPVNAELVPDAETRSA